MALIAKHAMINAGYRLSLTGSHIGEIDKFFSGEKQNPISRSDSVSTVKFCPEDSNQSVDSFGSLDCDADAQERELMGILWKRSPNYLHGWQKRVFRLRRGELVYYKVNSPSLRGVIPISLIRSVRVDSKRNFTLICDTKEFLLKAEDEDTATMWVEAITAVKRSLDHISYIPVTAPRFWRREPAPVSKHTLPEETIRAKQIFTEAATGDILLFRTKGIRAKISRMMTGSDYDHVAVILRFKNGGVGVLEALGFTGVQISNFEMFIREEWHKQYEEISIRRLNRKVTSLEANTLENFVRQSVGQRFGWSPFMRYRRKSIIPKAEEDRTYFCSELIATAYKTLGLLSKEIPGCCYMPDHFASSGGLELLKGMSLGKETMILF